MSDLSSYSSAQMDKGLATQRPFASRPKLQRSKSIVEILLRAQNNEMEDQRCKNIRKTEMFVFLREAILRIGAFFQGLDPVYHRVNMAPDYSLESHSNDLAAFMSSVQTNRKRARALTDFERKDDDELGFRKNDLIVVLSERDEHCWVGELNGIIGW